MKNQFNEDQHTVVIAIAVHLDNTAYSFHACYQNHLQIEIHTDIQTYTLVASASTNVMQFHPVNRNQCIDEPSLLPLQCICTTGEGQITTSYGIEYQ